jgi:hypothetical protein
LTPALVLEAVCVGLLLTVAIMIGLLLFEGIYDVAFT